MNYFITRGTSITLPVRLFLGKFHYLKSMPRGCNKIFLLWDKRVLKGVACFGSPVGKVKHDYELKRFCLNGTVKNTGSWFIAQCIRQLKAEGAKSIISYADPAQGHEGTLYRAANFTYVGKQKQGTAFFEVNGKKIWYRNKGAECYKDIVFGAIKRMQPKHVYEYLIDKR